MSVKFKMAKDIISNCSSIHVERVNKADPVDERWGAEVIEITDEDIKALNNGKVLYCDNYEYAILIYKGGK